MSDIIHQPHQYRTDVVLTPVNLGEFTVGQLNAVVSHTGEHRVSFMDELTEAERAAYGTQVVFPNHNGYLSPEAHQRNAAIREADSYGSRQSDITLAVIAMRPTNL